MILLLCIDIPYGIPVCKPVFEAFHCFKSCHHGVVHIVVPVLSVAANTVKVLKSIQEIDHFANLAVCPKRKRIT